MAAEFKNLPRGLGAPKPIETNANSGVIYREKPNQTLTIKLAQELNQAFLSNIPDETTLMDLRMTRGKLKDLSKHKNLQPWALTIQKLQEEQKKQVNTTFLIADRTGIKNVGLIRNVELTDLMLKYELSIEKALFLKEAFTQEQPLTTPLNNFKTL